VNSSHLLAAYYRESLDGQAGSDGKSIRSMPPCPWQDRETAALRDHQAEVEVERAEKKPVA
jgi:hypothetical protein